MEKVISKENPWREGWNELRCLMAETFLSWALSLYPGKAPMKGKLAVFLRDELRKELGNKIG